MNTLRLSLLVASALCISTLSASHVRFPLAMWSEKAFDEVRESHEPQHIELVLDSLTSAADASNASNVVVIVKEGLSSRHLAKNARNYNFIKSQLINHARLYTNLEESLNATTFKAAYDNVLSYTLSSTDELESLIA